VNAEIMILKKPRLVVSALIGIAMIIVVIAGQGTIDLVGRYFELKAELKAVNQTAPLSRQARYSADALKEIDLNATIFRTISEAAQRTKVRVKRINSPVIFDEDDYQTVTQEVVLEGDFVNSVKCLSETSSKLKYIKLCSLGFERDQSPKNNVLYTKAYFQIIKSIK
jgi:hypothetical protein